MTSPRDRPAMPYGRVWTPERDAELIARHADGATDRAVADAVGMTLGAIYGRLCMLRAAGLISRRPPAGPRPCHHDDARDPLARYATEAWPAKKLPALCAGWRAGETAVALADRLGVSKNALIGKVHRLISHGILEGRPSPISRRDEQAPSPSRSAHPPPPKPPPPAKAPPPPKPPPLRFAPMHVRSTRIAPTAPTPPPPSPCLYPRTTECCWPIGTPGIRDFRYCGAPTEPGRPYCADHCARAFVRLPRAARPDGHAWPPS